MSRAWLLREALARGLPALVTELRLKRKAGLVLSRVSAVWRQVQVGPVPDGFRRCGDDGDAPASHQCGQERFTVLQLGFPHVP